MAALRRAALLFAFASLAACSAAPAPQRSGEPSSTYTASIAPAARPTPSMLCSLGLKLTKKAQKAVASIPASWGPTHPPIAMTAAGGVERWWTYSPDKPLRLQVSALGGDGAPGNAVEVTALGDPDRFIGLKYATDSALTALLAAVQTGPTSSGLMLTTVDAAGRFSPALTVIHDAAVNALPAIAAGPPGRFAVAWVRGMRPTAEIHFALIEGARVIAHRTIDRDANPGGLSLVATGRGYLLVVSNHYEISLQKEGFTAIALGPDGQVLARRALMTDEEVSLTMGAWDGRTAGVAFRWHHRSLGFLRLSADGAPLGEPVLLGPGDEPGASLHPTSIVASQGLFWIGVEVTLMASVIEAASPEARVLAVRSDDTATRPLVLPQAVGGSFQPHLMPSASGVRGVFLKRASKWSLQGFEASCRAGPDDIDPPDPCDPSLVALAPGRYEPVRDRFNVIGAKAADIFVATRKLGDSMRGEKPSLAIARMGRDGAVRWSARSSHDTDSHDPPAIAASGAEVGAVFATKDKDLLFLALDAETGARRAARVLRRGADVPSHNACIAPREGGYLALQLHARGATLRWLRADGTEERSHDHSNGIWNGCAIARHGPGWLLAMTRRGPHSESNHLLITPIDPHGAPLRGSQRVGGGFARDPVLFSQKDGAVLAWTGPALREVLMTKIAPDGTPEGETWEAARDTGIKGFGIIEEEDGPRLIYASTKSYVERRVCPPPP